MGEEKLNGLLYQKRSRRDVLRLMALAGSAAAVELAFKPIENLTEWAEYLGLLPEGNIYQRAKIFGKISKSILGSKTPQEREENIQALTAWLKFNAVEYYGKIKNYHLASTLVRHFLFGRATSEGKAEPVDISKIFTRSVREEIQRHEVERITEEQALEKFFGRTLNHTLYSLPFVDYPHQTEGLTKESLETGQTGGRVKIQTLALWNLDVPPDIHYSLHLYNLGCEGVVQNVARTEEVGYQVTLENPQLTIYDIYDWDLASTVEEEIKLGENLMLFTNHLLYQMGIREPDKKMMALLGEERLAELYQAKLSVSDKDGALLAEKGLGHEFEVGGSFSLPKVTFTILEHVVDHIELKGKSDQ